jgi:hypothetical protein
MDNYDIMNHSAIQRQRSAFSFQQSAFKGRIPVFKLTAES